MSAVTRNFADDALHPNRTGYAWANAVLGQVARYTESMGRVPDDRRQKTWAWFVQDTWKPTSKITLDLGLRMYKWGPALAQGGEASVFSDDRFDPKWGGNPPVFYQPVLQGTTRVARNRSGRCCTAGGGCDPGDGGRRSRDPCETTDESQ